MTAIDHRGVAPSQRAVAGGGRRMKRVVFPFDCEMEVSQRLVEASHSGDIRVVTECLANPNVDVNFSGVVWLRGRKPEVLLREEMADEVLFEYDVIKTEVSALFLAAHNGNRDLVCKLLNAGADINQKLFRGFATTASVRQGKTEILRLLVKSGASQSACEEALLEACCHNRAELIELLVASELTRHHFTTHALVLACTRGFIEVVGILMKHGVDTNATARILLRSLKPALHTNVDCTGLISAIVSRHVPVVRLLLQAGVKMDTKVSLGSWSWDIATGEEFRVGAGLSDPYGPTWCAVEYFESTGTILRMLLKHNSANDTYHGRSLLHHAILCSNGGAVSVLIDSGADVEMPVRTTGNVEFRPIHMAARRGSCPILEILIDSGCEIDSRTDSGDTSVMECAKYKREDCLRALLIAGADLGLVNSSGAFTASIANSNRWDAEFQRVILDVILSGKPVKSSNHSVFSPLMFLSRCGDVKALEALLKTPDVNLNEQDENGYSAVMVAAKEGHVDAFRFLTFSGANVNLRNKFGESAITISLLNKKNKDAFEKVILEYALENDISGGFYPLHCASRRGDIAAVCLLTSGVGSGTDVNNLDEDDYTPLMLAASEGHAEMCSLLISIGARCDIKTSRGETALSLARISKKSSSSSCSDGGSNNAENVILNELSRVFVLNGGDVKKHTKGGRGLPHGKMLRMVGGVLRWGRSSRRNVVCKEAEVGSSVAFQRCRRRRRRTKGDDDACCPGVFRVISSKNREVHFECEGGIETAEMWVRGIRVLGNQH